MRGNNRKSIASIGELPQLTTMNVIDGQAGIVRYSSLIFYSLTIDNILNIIVLLILAGISIAMLTGNNGILSRVEEASKQTDISEVIEQAKLDIMGVQAENEGKITDEQVEEIIASYDKDGDIKTDEDDNQYIETTKGDKILASDIWTSGKNNDGELSFTVDGIEYSAPSGTLLGQIAIDIWGPDDVLYDSSVWSSNWFGLFDKSSFAGVAVPVDIWLFCLNGSPCSYLDTVQSSASYTCVTSRS